MHSIVVQVYRNATIDNPEHETKTSLHTNAFALCIYIYIYIYMLDKNIVVAYRSALVGVQPNAFRSFRAYCNRSLNIHSKSSPPVKANAWFVAQMKYAPKHRCSTIE